MLLLHEFHKRKFILPDKLTNRERNKLADQRAGGLDADDDILDDAQGVSSGSAARSRAKLFVPMSNLLVLDQQKNITHLPSLLLGKQHLS